MAAQIDRTIPPFGRQIVVKIIGHKVARRCPMAMARSGRVNGEYGSGREPLRQRYECLWPGLAMQETPKRRNWAIIVLLSLGLALTTVSVVVTAQKARVATMGGLL